MRISTTRRLPVIGMFIVDAMDRLDIFLPIWPAGARDRVEAG